MRRAEQLNFLWQVEKRTPAGVVVQANYAFTQPSRGVIEFIPNDDGIFRILLSISEVGGDGTLVTASPVDVTVTNTSPVVSLTSSTTSGAIGVPVHLQANISEPRTIDTFVTTWSIQRNGRDEPGLGSIGNPDTNFFFSRPLAVASTR